MKKITSYLIIMIILFNFIFCNNAYASDNTLGVEGINQNTFPASSVKSLAEGGDAKDVDSSGNERKNQASRDNFGTIALKSVIGLIFEVINFFPIMLQGIMTTIAYDGATTSKLLTIEDMVFGKISVLSVDFFDDNCNSEVIKKFRESVCKWYYSLRIIASAFSLVILVYVGIRMAASVTSGDKAKYKQMLMGWFESLLILFMLHYIIAMFVGLGNVFNEIINDMNEGAGGTSFEDQIITKVYDYMLIRTDWEYALYSVIFWILVGIQTKFFLAYAKRMLTVGFLILISPIVSIVYAIDKAGDGKAQSFGNWMKELGTNVMIQPIEGLIYMVFMSIAGEIANTSILVAAVFLLGLTKIEKTVLQIFHVRGHSLNLAHDQRKKG